jgi:beta-lactam-binding protein with PASTA domain
MNFVRFLFTGTFLKHFILSILLVLALILFYFFMLSWYTNHGEEIKVPSVVKLTQLQYEDVLGDLNLDYTVTESSVFNPAFPPNSVLEQTPKPGRMVKEGRKIYLKLNPADYALIKVPNLVFKTKRQAIPTLEALGFKVGKFSYEANIAKDLVLEMRSKGKRINAGDKLRRTSSIELVLGDPTLMPDYVPDDELSTQATSPVVKPDSTQTTTSANAGDTNNSEGF